MAVAFSELTAGETNVDASTYTTASVTLTAGNLYLLGVAVTHATAAIAPTTITTTGLALSFTVVDAGTNFGTISFTDVWRCLPGSTVTDTVVITAATTTGAIWSIVEVTGMDTTGTNGSGAIVQSHVHTANSTSDTNTLSSNITSGNARYSYGAKGENNSTTFTTTSGTWSQGTKKAHASPAAGGVSAWNANPATTDTSAIWTPNASNQIGSTIIEILAASTSTVRTELTLTGVG